MIDLEKLTDDELLQLHDDVRNFVIHKKLPEPEYNLHNSIQIEDRSYVNSDTLIPTLEFKISVNKEDLKTYAVLWESYYTAQKRFYKYHNALPPEKQVTIDIKHAIQRSFMDYLDKVFPTVHYI